MALFPGSLNLTSRNQSFSLGSRVVGYRYTLLCKPLFLSSFSKEASPLNSDSHAIARCGVLHAQTLRAVKEASEFKAMKNARSSCSPWPEPAVKTNQILKQTKIRAPCYKYMILAIGRLGPENYQELDTRLGSAGRAYQINEANQTQ